MSFVSKAWNSKSIRGKVAYVVKEKLKHLKEKLRIWNMEIFRYLDLEIEKEVSKWNLLHLKALKATYSCAFDRDQASSRVRE